MNRKEVLNYINEVIENEHGTTVLEEDDYIVDADIDSFGILSLFLELDRKYNAFPKKNFNAKDLVKLKVKDLIDVVEKHKKGK